MGILDSAKEALSGDDGSLVDKAKDAVNAHQDTVDKGVERAGDMVDDKTGGKYSGQVDKAQSTITDKTGNL